MVVYADILMLVNFMVDYFLLLLAARFLHKQPRMWRLLLGAGVGAVFSLYIFLPQSNFLFEIAVHILMSCALCFAVFGFFGIKEFLRNVAVLVAVNFAYSGAMIAVWLLFEPYGMVINNSMVYFNISPLFLIIFSLIGYFAAVIIKSFVKKTFPQNIKCDVYVFYAEKTFFLSGIADTGNSLKDVFGISQIFIIDPAAAQIMFFDSKENDLNSRYRAVPCNTVTGAQILDGYRVEKADVVYQNRKYSFKNPIFAVSLLPLDECQVIVNPEIF